VRTSPKVITDTDAGIDAQTIQAVMRNRYGTADGLQIRTVARPSISASQVLVQVQSAGTDRRVWHLMTGEPYAVRLAVGLTRPMQPVLGLDVAGLRSRRRGRRHPVPGR
jgi:D-arabinose 1-dehydrogenase-like Zn-dependent alcohol dehydrogenase